MNPFTVLWTRECLDELAARYLAAQASGFGNELTAAMDAIERAIDRDPTAAGESRGGADRVLAAGRAVVWFEVFIDARTVVVKRAGWSAPRPR